MSNNQKITWTHIYLKFKDEIINCIFNTTEYAWDLYLNIRSYFFAIYVPSLVYTKHGKFDDHKLYYQEQLNLKFDQYKKDLTQKLMKQLQHNHYNGEFDDFYWSYHTVFRFREKKDK
eukprot:NODE_367_length_8687_cov_0.577084.p8 type:complete len:117 gc:universal NODE_367_length_8687_cov_0.577084:1463-1113(-)